MANYASGAASGGPISSITVCLGTLGTLSNVGTSLYGLYQQNQLKKLAQMAMQQSDPWGQSGGRALAGGQLQGLLRDPSSITKMPGYQAGLEAVQRSLGSQGYQGSGNMMAALSKYGGDFYNNALSQLGYLGGAGLNPATGASLNLQGNMGAANLGINSLGLLGRTAGMMGWSSTDALLQRLLTGAG